MKTELVSSDELDKSVKIEFRRDPAVRGYIFYIEHTTRDGTVLITKLLLGDNGLLMHQETKNLDDLQEGTIW